MTKAKATSSNRTRDAPARKVVAYTFVSMDGVMQAPGGPDEDPSSGFRHGGWSMSFWDEKMGREMTVSQAEPSEMLLGRRTYDIFASFWPSHREQDGAAVMNGSRKYVASRTRRKLEWENSVLLEGDAADAVRKLKSTPGPELRVVGSGELLQSLLRADLVDGVVLWVFPVVLGSGRRVFDHGAIPGAWRLVESHSFDTGVISQTYERAGELVYGGPPGS